MGCGNSIERPCCFSSTIFFSGPISYFQTIPNRYKFLDSSWDLLEEAQQKITQNWVRSTVDLPGSDGKRYRSFPPTAHRRSRARGCGCLEGISFARQKLLVVWFQCKPIYLLGEWSVFLAKHGEMMRNARHESLVCGFNPFPNYRRMKPPIRYVETHLRNITPNSHV